MKLTPHISEEDLIEFRLHDSASERKIRMHLETCAQCAARSEEIAETLRIFSGQPVPPADPDRSWRKLRDHLRPLGAEEKRMHVFPLWGWPALAFGIAAMVLLAFGGLRVRDVTRISKAAIEPLEPSRAATADANPAAQLASAERLLTVVNHTSGPLDAITRSQAQALLLRNTASVNEARREGRFGEAMTLANLGRVLTNIDAAPSAPDAGLQLRTEWNTAGLLFDLRILQQDRTDHRAQPTEEIQ